jgi:undecaprenyl diphosphate synthase
MTKSNKIKHLAIIMDGNRRWATARGLPKLFGHTEGAKTLKKIATAVKKRDIPYLTVWALSTENLKNRSEKELKHLFKLFGKLTDYLDDFFKNDAKLNLIGDIEALPNKTQEKLNQVLEKTKDNKSITLTLAINYGGRDEILRAAKKSKGNLTGEKFSNNLDTYNLPDPDLIIRTGGHKRLSGFLPWQSVYAELYFTDTFWPAFNEEELDKAINWYQAQQQNRGK